MDMKPCSFSTCMSRLQQNRQAASFHEFPTCEEIRTKWVAIVRSDRHDPTWTPTDESRVCSLHFPRSQFITKSVLHSRAVPIRKYKPPRYLRSNRRRSIDSDQPEEDTPDVTAEIPDAALAPVGETPPDEANGGGASKDEAGASEADTATSDAGAAEPSVATSAVTDAIVAADDIVPDVVASASAPASMEIEEALIKEIMDDTDEKKEEAKDEEKTEEAAAQSAEEEPMAAPI